MANLVVKESAAATAAGTDLMSGNFFQFSPFPRTVTRVGCVGSSAVGNAAVDIFFGTEKVGTFYNTTSGANVISLEAKDMLPLRSNKALLPNEPLRVIINTASATNVLAVTLEIQEL